MPNRAEPTYFPFAPTTWDGVKVEQHSAAFSAGPCPFAMLGLLRVARNAIWPHPFKFTLEYAESNDSGSNPIVDMIRAHCPDLSGANAPPQPTRWLPSGHAQTMYSAVGDFSVVDEVEYKRKVFLTPDGGTVAVDIGRLCYLYSSSFACDKRGPGRRFGADRGHSSRPDGWIL